VGRHENAASVFWETSMRRAFLVIILGFAVGLGADSPSVGVARSIPSRRILQLFSPSGGGLDADDGAGL